MIHPKQSLGQNFLMHQQTADRIADAAMVTPETTVLEIGSGTGMLTRALLARAKKVFAVEADGELVHGLEETFANEIAVEKFVLTEGDIRKFDASTIKDSYALVANIPYYLTGEILRRFLTEQHKPTSMTLLVQKEVAERIARLNPKKPKESLLSLSVKAYGTPKYCFLVPRGAFYPAPNVDSAVLSITNISNANFPTPAPEAQFFNVLHAGFAHKRKRLAKNLETIAPKAKLQEIFAKVAIPLDVRSEDVSLDTWLTLAREIPS